MKKALRIILQGTLEISTTLPNSNPICCIFQNSFHSMRSHAWDLAMPYGDSHIDTFMQACVFECSCASCAILISHYFVRRTPSVLSRLFSSSAPTAFSSQTRESNFCRYGAFTRAFQLLLRRAPDRHAGGRPCVPFRVGRRFNWSAHSLV